MNGAHQHLILNHLPILGLGFAALVLAIGLIAKSQIVRVVGISLFLIASLSALPTMATGEDAEHVLEHRIESGQACSESCGTECSKDMKEEMEEKLEHYIHEHEEKAEGLMPFMWGLIAFSLIALFLEYKKKPSAVLLSGVILFVGIVALYFAKQVGTSGGEISHPEIRTEAEH